MAIRSPCARRFIIGAPVIATDNGMRPAGVQLVPVHDAARLRDVILELLAAPAPRPAPAGDGQENIRAIMDFYREVLTRDAGERRRA